MTYLDLARTFSGDLPLPWNGVDWVVAEPSAKESTRLRELYIHAAAIEPEDDMREMMKLLGHPYELDDPNVAGDFALPEWYSPDRDVWQALVDAGIGWASLIHLARTAVIHFTGLPELAEGHWSLKQFAETVIDFEKLVSQ